MAKFGTKSAFLSHVFVGELVYFHSEFLGCSKIDKRDFPLKRFENWPKFGGEKQYALRPISLHPVWFEIHRNPIVTFDSPQVQPAQSTPTLVSARNRFVYSMYPCVMNFANRHPKFTSGGQKSLRLWTFGLRSFFRSASAPLPALLRCAMKFFRLCGFLERFRNCIPIVLFYVNCWLVGFGVEEVVLFGVKGILGGFFRRASARLPAFFCCAMKFFGYVVFGAFPKLFNNCIIFL